MSRIIFIALIALALICFIAPIAQASDLRLIGMGYMHKIVADDTDYQFNVANVVDIENIKYLGKYDIYMNNSGHGYTSSYASSESTSKTNDLNLENTLILPLSSIFTLGLEYNPGNYQYDSNEIEDLQGSQHNEKENSQILGAIFGMKLLGIKIGLGTRSSKSDTNAFFSSGGVATPESTSSGGWGESLIGLGLNLGPTSVGAQYKTKIQHSEENNQAWYSDWVETIIHDRDSFTETNLSINYPMSLAFQVNGFASWSDENSPFSEIQDEWRYDYQVNKKQKEYLLGAEQKIGKENILAYGVGLKDSEFSRSNSNDWGKYEYCSNEQELSIKVGTEFKLLHVENLLARFGVIQEYNNGRTQSIYRDSQNEIESIYSQPFSSWNTAYTTGLGYKYRNIIFDMVFTAGVSPLISRGSSYEYIDEDYYGGENETSRGYSRSSSNTLLFGVTLDI